MSDNALDVWLALMAIGIGLGLLVAYRHDVVLGGLIGLVCAAGIIGIVRLIASGRR